VKIEYVPSSEIGRKKGNNKSRGENITTNPAINGISKSENAKTG